MDECFETGSGHGPTPRSALESGNSNPTRNSSRDSSLRSLRARYEYARGIAGEEGWKATTSSKFRVLVPCDTNMSHGPEGRMHSRRMNGEVQALRGNSDRIPNTLGAHVAQEGAVSKYADPGRYLQRREFQESA